MTRCRFIKTNGNLCKLNSKINEFCHLHTHHECIICMSKIPNLELKKTECNHCFHNQCLDKWLERDNTCPLCRCKIKQRVFKVSVCNNPLLYSMNSCFFITKLQELEFLGKFKGNKLYIDAIDESTCGVYYFYSNELISTFKLN
jgi:hypothetical protein